MQTASFISSNFFSYEGGTISSSDNAESCFDWYSSESQPKAICDIVEFKPADNIFFLAEYLRQGRIKNELILELEDIKGSIAELKEDGIDLNIESLEDSYHFVTDLLKSLSSKLPILEFNPNGTLAFTWRKKQKGILNIAFAGGGLVTWAAYLEVPQEQSLNGSFKLNEGLPFPLKDIVNIIFG